MTPLGKLIEERKQAHVPPLTNTDIARAMGMSRQRVQQLISDDIEDVPPSATLRKLAFAISAPVAQVVNAALEGAGLPSGFGDDHVIYRTGYQAGYGAGILASVNAIKRLR